MSDKTKQYWWLPWAVAIASAIAIGIILTRIIPHNWFAPWSIAQSLASVIGLNEFGAGFVPMPSYWSWKAASLVSIILTIVLGPSLWIYAEIKNQSDDSETGDPLRKGLVWYMGVILVVFSLQIVPSTVIKMSQNKKAEIAEIGNRDKLYSTLTRLGYDAVEKFYLPQHLGGGSQSFTAIKDKNGGLRPIKMTDLESYNPDLKNSYLLAPVKSDSLIKIIGVGHQPGPNPKFKNANGQQGKLQVALEVAPPESFRFVNPNWH